MTALLAFTLSVSLPIVASDADRRFALGVASRNDGAAARVHFARAAELLDELRAAGVRDPRLAMNRARAHRLAGNLPACLAALHDGLDVARHDRELQVELESARDAVEYANADLAAAVRPPPLRGLGTRMSVLELYLVAGGLWLAACLGAARYAMTRVPGWLVAAGASLALLAILAGAWRSDRARIDAENARPLRILERDCPLKAGNGDSWPDRLKWPLPAGAEVRELARRGGWVQVELANGTAGWLPERTLRATP